MTEQPNPSGYPDPASGDDPDGVIPDEATTTASPELLQDGWPVETEPGCDHMIRVRGLCPRCCAEEKFEARFPADEPALADDVAMVVDVAAGLVVDPQLLEELHSRYRQLGREMTSTTEKLVAAQTEHARHQEQADRLEVVQRELARVLSLLDPDHGRDPGWFALRDRQPEALTMPGQGGPPVPRAAGGPVGVPTMRPDGGIPRS